MKITFTSHVERAELANALLFAQHSDKEIAATPHEGYRETMRRENEKWKWWERTLAAAQTLEVTL